ncbi:MAG: hypothetical protein ICV52_08750 [Microcoleus sp. C1-bin4]|nr:hypothetical protein [Microcoleus sp. C1-bin4]
MSSSFLLVEMGAIPFGIASLHAFLAIYSYNPGRTNPHKPGLFVDF